MRPVHTAGVARTTARSTSTPTDATVLGTSPEAL